MNNSCATFVESAAKRLKSCSFGCHNKRNVNQKALIGVFVWQRRIKASDSEWFKLRGSFYIDFIPEKATFYIEGPPAGIDILIQNVDIRPHIPLEQSPQAMHKQVAIMFRASWNF